MISHSVPTWLIDLNDLWINLTDPTHSNGSSKSRETKETMMICHMIQLHNLETDDKFILSEPDLVNI